MLLAAVGLFTAFLRSEALADPGGNLTWWMLAIGFVISESLVIHLPVQRDSHTVSMSEIPLVLGLALDNPAAVIAGRFIAGAIVLTARRQPFLKLSFNLSLFTLETTVALIVYQFVLGAATPSSPQGWLAAMTGIAIAVTVSAALVDIVIALNDRRRRLAEIVRSFSVGSLISIGVGFLGTIAVVMVEHEPRAVLLLAVTVAFLFILFRSFGILSRRHDDLSSLYTFTNQMDGTLGSRDIAVVTLREAISILRVEHGEIILSEPTDSHASYLGFSAGEDPAQRKIPTAEVAELFDISLGTKSDRIFGPETRDSRLRISLGTDLGCGMIAPIRHGNGSVGVLVVAGRTGIAKRFSSTELELLDTIANHASLTLERARVIEQLRKEIAAKQEVIRSKDQLIAAVSHELRTPLTGVLGFAEMLRDHRDDFSAEDEDAMLLSIAEEAGDLTNLVEDLLTAARAQMGSLTIVALPVALQPLISRVIETTSGTAHHVVISGPNANVIADDGRVRQILRNLITNAQRYGGHQVHVSTHVVGRNAHIRVSDNGDGIPESDQERIFAPYESAHDPGTQPGSLGLGLAISRSLARLMGGDLMYRRNDGWTMFDFRLPLVADEPAAAAAAAPATIELERV
jgi:signal transduction histidine kinase